MNKVRELLVQPVLSTAGVLEQKMAATLWPTHYIGDASTLLPILTAASAVGFPGEQVVVCNTTWVRI
jgi:hypothetical protein